LLLFWFSFERGVGDLGGERGPEKREEFGEVGREWTGEKGGERGLCELDFEFFEKRLIKFPEIDFSKESE